MASQAWPRQGAGAALLKAVEKLLNDTVLTISWAHLRWPDISYRMQFKADEGLSTILAS